MSSSDALTGGGGATNTASLRYFCHQCNRTVTIESSASGELACSICHGGFIEEFELPSSNPIPGPPFFPLNPAAAPFVPSASPSPMFLSRSTSFDLRHPSDIFSLFGPDSSLFRSPSATSDVGLFPSPSSGSETRFFSSPSVGLEPFNPFDFLQRYIQNLLSNGANIQIVLENGDRPIGNLGDYFIGPGLEQLIQQLAENDPNRYGPPPAAKSAVSSLPDIKITDVLLASDEAQCAVCKEVFEIGEDGKQMPCMHIFHKDCILPWLELHNSCPVCRCELPTDDSDYEQRRGARNPVMPLTGERNSGGSDDAGGPPAGSVERNLVEQISSPVERRFRISLPWPFRGLGSQAEGNTGDEQGSGRGGGGNEASGSQARQEAKD